MGGPPGRRHRLPVALVLASLAAGPAVAEPAPFREPDGGGVAALPEEAPLDPARRAEIEARLAAGRRPAPFTSGSAGGPVHFRFPLRAANGLDGPGFHATSNFVDLDLAFPNQILDWACGARTYDRLGYNHSGTDFFPWPFEWRRMFESQVVVVAAAPGEILGKDDGHFDGSCVANDDPWNAVYVEHDDGTVAWYGHLKEGSTTSRPVGARVAAGDFLGVVGSSGSSTGPHLHFEIHGFGGVVIDPFAGPCGADTTAWNEQPAYFDSALNRISTHEAAPQTDTCNTPEETYERNRFDPGQAVFFAAFYRDQLASQTSTYTVRRPNGSVFSSWQHVAPAPHAPASWWYWTQTLPGNAPFGSWSFEVSYLGQAEVHTFQVPEPAAWLQGAVAFLAVVGASRAGRRQRIAERRAVARGDQASSRARIS